MSAASPLCHPFTFPTKITNRLIFCFVVFSLPERKKKTVAETGVHTVDTFFHESHRWQQK